MVRLTFVGVLAGLLLACSDTGLTPSEGYIDVEGGKVWYQITGSGTATPLLLLHGGPGAPSHYLEPLKSLTPGADLQIFEESAHMTMLDEPEAYADAVGNFLNKVDAPR